MEMRVTRFSYKVYSQQLKYVQILLKAGPRSGGSRLTPTTAQRPGGPRKTSHDGPCGLEARCLDGQHGGPVLFSTVTHRRLFARPNPIQICAWDGFTTEQISCGESGLGFRASRPPGRRAAGPLQTVGRGSFGPPNRAARSLV